MERVKILIVRNKEIAMDIGKWIASEWKYEKGIDE